MSEQNIQPTQPPASAQMFQFILGLMVPQAIHVAAKLGIADIVAKAAATADELAAVTKTHAPSLRRLLSFLASVDVFQKTQQESISRRRSAIHSVAIIRNRFAERLSRSDPGSCGGRSESFRQPLPQANRHSITFSVHPSLNTSQCIPRTPPPSTLR